jgi:hypothetical protein
VATEEELKFFVNQNGNQSIDIRRKLLSSEKVDRFFPRLSCIEEIVSEFFVKIKQRLFLCGTPQHPEDFESEIHRVELRLW